MVKRVAVVGASGFVGATLIERSVRSAQFEVIPIIHSSGNAWRLSRLGLPLRTADLLDASSVTAALGGATHVVNCSRGDDQVMVRGLANLLQAASDLKMQGFIHLSSVSVYGDPPAPDSATEDGTTEPEKGTYGWTKLQQDRMVQNTAQKGLPALILCPPNISGPYSAFLSAMGDSLRFGSLAVLEAGGAVCNLIDVNNLARAIELGLDHCSSRSPRLFVTDDEDITWRQVIDGLSPLYGDLPEPPSIERIALERLRDALNAKPKVNIIRSLKHLVSSDIRAALRRDPLWARVDTALRSSVAKLGLALEDKIRLSIEGPMVVQKHSSKPNINIRLSAQQLRGVRHSSAVAKRTINYAPQYSFTDSMAAYRAWYRNHTGRNTPMWSLAQYLWT